MTFRKIFDSLFEDEDELEEEVISEGPLEDIGPAFEAKEEKDDSVLDIFAEAARNKPETLIDIEVNENNNEAQAEAVFETYEKETSSYYSQPTISPIFGYVKEEAKQRPEPSIKNSQPRSEETSILGTIYSPIYGMMRPNDVEAEPEVEVPFEEVNEEPLAIEVETNFDLLSPVVEENNHEEQLINFADAESHDEVTQEIEILDEDDFDIVDDFEIAPQEEEISLFDELFNEHED